MRFPNGSRREPRPANPRTHAVLFFALVYDLRTLPGSDPNNHALLPTSFMSGMKLKLKAIAIEIAKVGKKKPTYTISFVKGVTGLLKLDLEVDQWDYPEGLLPMLNGVLDL